jgi:hypothetical protein
VNLLIKNNAAILQSKMKTVVTFFLILFVTQLTQAQMKFPDITGELLTGKKVSIPKDNNGKITLVGIAMSQKAEKALQTWFQPVFDNFIDQAAPNSIIPVDNYDVNIFFIPVITGAAQMAAGKIESEMRAGIDADFHQHVLIYKGATDDIRKTLAMEDKDTPYFFVVGKDGKVLHATSGKFTESKMEDIERFLE